MSQVVLTQEDWQTLGSPAVVRIGSDCYLHIGDTDDQPTHDDEDVDQTLDGCEQCCGGCGFDMTQSIFVRNRRWRCLYPESDCECGSASNCPTMQVADDWWEAEFAPIGIVDGHPTWEAEDVPFMLEDGSPGCPSTVMQITTMTRQVRYHCDTAKWEQRQAGGVWGELAQDDAEASHECSGLTSSGSHGCVEHGPPGFPESSQTHWEVVVSLVT